MGTWILLNRYRRDSRRSKMTATTTFFLLQQTFQRMSQVTNLGLTNKRVSSCVTTESATLSIYTQNRPQQARSVTTEQASIKALVARQGYPRGGRQATAGHLTAQTILATVGLTSEHIEAAAYSGYGKTPSPEARKGGHFGTERQAVASRQRG